MISDGRAKGAVDRKALHDTMDGIVRVLHERTPWMPKILAPKTATETSHASWPNDVELSARYGAYLMHHVLSGLRA